MNNNGFPILSEIFKWGVSRGSGSMGSSDLYFHPSENEQDDVCFVNNIVGGDDNFLLSSIEVFFEDGDLKTNANYKNIYTCIPLPCGFKDKSTITTLPSCLHDILKSYTTPPTQTPPSTRAMEYRWDFGDGTYKTVLVGQETEGIEFHNYANPGLYSVTLTITDPSTGASQKSQRHVRVGLPSSDFGVDNVCIGTPFVPSGVEGGADSYSWDFGNGATSTAQNAQHTYGTEGTYQVQLIVSKNGGGEACSDTTVKEVVVHEQISAVVNVPSSVCSGSEIEVEAISDDATSFKWYFGENEGTSSLRKAPYVYNNEGNYETFTRHQNS